MTGQQLIGRNEMNDRNIPMPFERFKHFKGGEYQVLMIAEDSGTGESIVVYQALYHPYKIYTRSLEEFLSDVDRNKYPDVAQKERFAPLQRPTQTFVQRLDGITDQMRAAVSTNKNAASDTTSRTVAVSSRSTAAGTYKESMDSRAEVPVPTPSMKKSEGQINPALLKFLDARTVEEKLAVLYEIRDEITPEILTPMELSLGMEPIDDTVEKRVRLIKETLMVRDQYEKRRLR